MDNVTFFTTLTWLIPLPPLVGFVLIILFTNRNKKLSHRVALTGTGLSFLASMIVVVKAFLKDDLTVNPIAGGVNWLPAGNNWLKIGVAVDPLTTVMLFFVAWTILMIFIYSIGYHNFGQRSGVHDRPGLPPHGAEVTRHGQTLIAPTVEPMYSRFFALISLFAFAMFLLVVSDNLLTLYIGWELMGLCSYLLIGFWYGKDSARKAALKAFITTRIGDVFMLLGIAALYSQAGTLNFHEIFSDAATMETLVLTTSPVFNLSWAGLIGLLLFFGTVGKSAQFPLHVWLPDAMEGPTPVSAMIHAATMVSAGVYLAARIFPLVSAGWHHGEPLNVTMTVMAAIGAFTALFAATIALAQNDVKRVLAYSTISQLGYMIAALGIGAFTAAVFHLITHAFFKALLFLGSGSVIHGMEHGVFHSGEHIDPQDMTNMGGLRKKMPITFWTFVAGGLALSGFPLITAGFWSKDEILSGAFGSGQILIFSTLALAALLTAFYTARQITLVFLGKPRTGAAEHAHESVPSMTLPLVILSVFAIGLGWFGIPHAFPLLGKISTAPLQTFLGTMLHSTGGEEVHSLVPLFTSLLVSLGGLLLGWLIYRKVSKPSQSDPLNEAFPRLFALLNKKYYLDEIYGYLFIRPSLWFSDNIVYRLIDQKLIDGVLHGIAALGLKVGNLLRFGFDLPVINKAGDELAEGTHGLGNLLRHLQSGRVQQYLTFGIACLVIAGVAILSVMGRK